jgi:hypothetical protein
MEDASSKADPVEHSTQRRRLAIDIRVVTGAETRHIQSRD